MVIESIMRKYTVKVVPSEHTFTVKEDQTVLDAALNAGVVLPYSCRSGTCSTCKGRVVSGDFDAGAAPENILDPDELAQGYTLLCQARPHSDMVVDAQVIRMADDIEVRKMPGRIMEIDALAPDVRRLMVQLPASQPVRYYPGQYLEFIMRDGRRRSYSMANAPLESNRVELHIRHMPGGAFTDHVFGTGQTQMKIREIQRVELPLGSFFLREDSDAPIVFLVSGTGFAPIKAIVEHMQQASIRRPAVLYWGGRRPHDLYMNELAEQWASELPGFEYIPVVSEALDEDGWTGRTGFVHHAVMADLPDLSSHQVYACGTPAMVEAARHDFIKQNQLPESAFFADAFTSEADVVV